MTIRPKDLGFFVRCKKTDPAWSDKIVVNVEIVNYIVVNHVGNEKAGVHSDRHNINFMSMRGKAMRRTRILSLATWMLLSTFACVAFAADGKEETNIKTVRAFYEKALNDKNFEAAAQYLGAQYKQHNPRAANGAEGLKSYLQFLRDKFPQSHSEIKRAFADGDYVILHVHAVREPGTLGQAIIDIFRLDHGKIVEHWDVIQDVAEKPLNDNTMF